MCIYRAVVRRLCARWMLIEERGQRAVEKSTNEVDEFSSNFQPEPKVPRVRAIATPSTKETRTPWKLRSWSLQACTGARNVFPCSACLLHCVTLRTGKTPNADERYWRIEGLKKKSFKCIIRKKIVLFDFWESEKI